RDPELHLELHLVGERRDDEFLVEDRDRRIRLDQLRGDLTGAARRQAHRAGLVPLQPDHEVLDVQDDVGDILHDARERRELVLRALDLDADDRGPLDGREEDAPEAVANGGAEAALERLDKEAAEAVALELRVGDDPAREFHPTPTYASAHVTF